MDKLELHVGIKLANLSEERGAPGVWGALFNLADSGDFLKDSPGSAYEILDEKFVRVRETFVQGI